MPSQLVSSPSPALSVGVWLFFTLASTASALTLVDNFDAEGTDAAAELVGVSSLFATSFTTGTEAATINTATIKFYNEDLVSHDLVAYLYSSTDGLPGAVLATSATATIASGVPSDAVFDFGSVGVDALTTYWVAYGLVDSTLFDPVYGWFTSENAETSDYGWTLGWDSAYSLDGGTSWVLDTTDLSYLSISGSVGAVPEPAAWALTAGLLGAAAALRRGPGRRRPC